MVQPSKLLQDLRVVRLVREHLHVGITGVFILRSASLSACFTHISILLIHVSQLEPYIPRSQWSRGVGKDVFETLGSALDPHITHLERCLIFALMFVDDAEAEVNLIGLFKVWD